MAAKTGLRDKLRSYLLRPVIRAVEIGEPLHYLTEMRQVVIVFVNVITSEVEKKKLILLVDKAYQHVCKYAAKTNLYSLPYMKKISLTLLFLVSTYFIPIN